MTNKDGYNEKALIAWNEWKEVCAVNGCNAENQTILKKEIERGFREKLKAFSNAFEVSENHDFGEIDYVTEFDSALVEYEHSEEDGHEIYHKGRWGEKKHVRKAKCWKDFTWEKIAESSDPDLKVIRGKLTGQKSVMDCIVEDYLSRNCPGRFERQDGKLFYILDSQYQEGRKSGEADDVYKQYHPESDTTLSSSNDSEQKNDSGKDCFAEFLYEEEIDRSVLDKLKSLLDGHIDIKECAILLASAYGIALYKEKEILSELGIAKSAVYNALPKIQAKILQAFASAPTEEFCEIFKNSVVSRKMMLNCMKERLRVEKYAPSLLLRVEEKSGE